MSSVFGFNIGLIVFGISTGALFHSYVLYPWLLKIWVGSKKLVTLQYQKNEELPNVSIIMSVYNEAAVIEAKLHSLLELNYPDQKTHLYIGSDASSDETNQIIHQFQQKHSNIHFFPFQNRRGKPEVVNELTEIAKAQYGNHPDHLFLLTDASVMLTPDTLYHLAKHFKQPEVALVDSNMQHMGMEVEGISRSEHRYISREVFIKHRESILWKTMVGPFGGCYMIRSTYFQRIPPNFLVDDFYVTMKVLEKGQWVINDLDAHCLEPVSHEIKEEFRRKSRISAGNFQNLTHFFHLWWPPIRPLNFAFFSHKILRWLGPFFLLGALLSATYLSFLGSFLFLVINFLLLIGLIGIPLTDFLLSNWKINVLPFRNIRYFVLMNIALLYGFFKYLKGIKTNVWQPTKRHI